VEFTLRGNIANRVALGLLKLKDWGYLGINPKLMYKNLIRLEFYLSYKSTNRSLLVFYRKKEGWMD
jgi:hypothetical protein